MPPPSALFAPVAAPPRPARGFTLIEVLIVLLILGIALAGVSLSIDGHAARDTRMALERLRFTLEASAERAQLRGQPLAFELLADGYRFSVQDASGKWVALDEPPVFTERVLPAPLAWAELSTEEDPNGANRRIIFRSEAPRFRLRLNAGALHATLDGRATGAVQLSTETLP